MEIKISLKKAITYIVLIIIIVFLCIVNIDSLANQSKDNNFYKTLSILLTNLKTLSSYLLAIMPFLLLIAIMFLVFGLNGSSLKVEKLSIGGVNVLFDKPDNIFRQQMKNFLNTKRTLYRTDPEIDNFYETFDSYFCVYNFIRDSLKIYDNKKSKNSQYYKAALEIIQHLNLFLAKHQNNFRRWYNYQIESKTKDTHDINISQLQSTYRNYQQLINDFQKTNNLFIKYAELFEININGWFIKEAD